MRKAWDLHFSGQMPTEKFSFAKVGWSITGRLLDCRHEVWCSLSTVTPHKFRRHGSDCFDNYFSKNWRRKFLDLFKCNFKNSYTYNVLIKLSMLYWVWECRKVSRSDISVAHTDDKTQYNWILYMVCKQCLSVHSDPITVAVFICVCTE